MSSFYSKFIFLVRSLQLRKKNMNDIITKGGDLKLTGLFQ